MTKSGGASAIEKHFIAFGLHRLRTLLSANIAIKNEFHTENEEKFHFPCGINKKAAQQNASRL